jgi:hypothetical protein
MVTKRKAESVEGLLREILTNTKGANSKEPGLRTLRSFDSFVGRDYSDALRKLFDSRQLEEIFAEMRTSLPELNKEYFGL